MSDGTHPDPGSEDARREFNVGPEQRWQRVRRFGYHHPGLGIWLDLSCMRVAAEDVGLCDGPMATAMERALAQMDELEAGAVANPDEGRRVGHYWLRDPHLAPDPDIRRTIEQAAAESERVAARVHDGSWCPARAARFEHLVVVGIGGSALGPQLVSDALATSTDRMSVHFVDNTDPDGIDRLLATLGDGLEATLCVIISKSGGTKETRNGMLELRNAYERRGLDFGKHAVAVTGEGSQLASYAAEHGFVAQLPMWAWVGGRTSVTSPVGLLPAALQGLDIKALHRGARLMDQATRRHDVAENPAALLAASWHYAGEGRGLRDMVIIPYKDRLVLLSRYLQQLVMESLGKRLDLEGNVVEQGIVVYGNKGSTDQHAYVQQLLDGLDNGFVTFVEVLEDRAAGSDCIEVDPGVTTGDYLSGFLQGTRQALRERGRQSITLTVDRVDPATLGALIALFERAVGLYALLVNINAYHQPAVESGKRAAGQVLELQRKLCVELRAQRGTALGIAELAQATDSDDRETVFWIMRHLAANPHHGIRAVANEVNEGADPWQERFVAD
jgi:glucose-6-phosphate isomerase